MTGKQLGVVKSVRLAEEEVAVLERYAWLHRQSLSGVIRAALQAHVPELAGFDSYELELTPEETGDLYQGMSEHDRNEHDHDDAPDAPDLRHHPRLLSCPRCQAAFAIERVQTGYAAVQGHSWWMPATQHWVARCACNVLFGLEEGDLYRQMGLGYA